MIVINGARHVEALLVNGICVMKGFGKLQDHHCIYHSESEGRPLPDQNAFASLGSPRKQQAVLKEQNYELLSKECDCVERKRGKSKTAGSFNANIPSECQKGNSNLPPVQNDPQACRPQSDATIPRKRKNLSPRPISKAQQ